MAEYNLGRVAFYDKGAYSEEESYEKWDFTTTDDSTYLYINDLPSIGKAVTNTDYWKCIADGKPATLAAAAADLAAENADTATENCETATEACETATGKAVTATSNANEATTNANNAATNATEAAEACEEQTEACKTQTEACETATKNANTATEAANTAAENADDKATLANTAAENADAASDSMLSNLISLEIKDNLNLYFKTPDTYSGMTFNIENGNLIATI